MSDKQNPFELFDGEWFKDATSQLCQDGWPAFIVPLNIGIKNIRKSHQELESALESAKTELINQGYEHNKKVTELELQLESANAKNAKLRAALNKIGMLGASEHAYTSEFTTKVVGIVREVLK